MDTSFDVKAQLLKIYENMIESVTSAAPRVITGIVVIILALIGAKIIERILRAVLSRIKFDAMLGRVGIDKMLQKVGITQALSAFLPRVVYYILLFLFAQAITEAMGLKAISDAIAGFLAYLPNLISALIVLVLGSLLGQYVGSMVTRAADGSGIDFAPTLGNLVSGLILMISAIMAVAQLKIDTEIVRIVAVCLLAGFALAFGLSFGLGSRDFTRNIIAGFYAKKLLAPGDEIELKGRRGVVAEITPIQTLVRSDEQTIAVSNSTLLEDLIKR